MHNRVKKFTSPELLLSMEDYTAFGSLQFTTQF